MTTNIYTLRDPITNEIRYVGKANNIKQRFKAHLNGARKHQIHKKNWINSLKKLKLKPIVEIIDIVPIEEWIFWETYWIAQIKSWGFNLINYTAGGDGCTFANKTSFKKGHGAKPIVALNANGEFVKEFKDTKAGEDFCGKKCVDGALRKRIKSAGGYLWMHKEDYDNISNEELDKFILWSQPKKRLPNSGCFKNGVPSGRLGQPLSEETKIKLRLKNSLQCKKVLQLDKNGNILNEFKSIGEAAKTVNGCAGGISVFCNGRSKSKTYKSFIWKFKN